MIAKLVIVSAVCALSARAQSPVPSDDQIRAILAQRIDEFHQSVGIVVGIIELGGSRRVIANGSVDKGDSRPLNGDTVFEIGSVTKVFTSLLLSDMVQRGEVALTDPVAKYLPANVHMPQRKGRQITLQDLATHTSGLPRIPTNFKPKDPANPYTDYTVAQLYARPEKPCSHCTAKSLSLPTNFRSVGRSDAAPWREKNVVRGRTR